MTILITGAAGRLGYIVAKHCIRVGYKVRAFDLPNVNWSNIRSIKKVEIIKGDITNPDSVARASKNVETVIHLAALLPPNSEIDKDLTNKVNVQGTKNILNVIDADAAIVFASSVSTYGITFDQNFPLTETQIQSTHNNYSESKIEAEKTIKESGNNYVILRIAPIGVADLLEIPDVIPYRGSQRVEFIYVEDVAYAVKACLNRVHEENEIYNIAGGDSWQMTGKDYINKFYSALGVEVKANYSDKYTAVDWYDTKKSQILKYQRTSFNHFQNKLIALGEELGLRSV
jgi:nucleoside-diphosphate-sugar epimerase